LRVKARNEKQAERSPCFSPKFKHQLVGERSIRSEAKGVSHGGAYGSENVGTSNHKSGERPDHRKPKVSLAMIVSQGLVGPKSMTKVADEGHTVNIP